MAITWKIDPAHSEIQFKVRHLMVTKLQDILKSLIWLLKLNRMILIQLKTLSLLLTLIRLKPIMSNGIRI